MRILGIDPGYERLGIAVVEKTTGKEVLLRLMGTGFILA
jgi:Holliday junction resolvasome RuvABC endonuclease subunit